MSFEPRDYLRHILIEIDYLLVQAAGGACAPTRPLASEVR